MPSLLKELLGLAEKVGQTRGEVRTLHSEVRAHALRLEALEESRDSASSAPTVSPGLMGWAKALAGRVSRRLENLSLWAKIALWATPRGLLAWGAWQGWNQTVLGWVQRVVDFW